MSGVVAYTSITVGYLDRAVVLVRSARRVHPDWRYVVVVVDEGPAVNANRHLLAEFDEVVLARDLGIPEFRRWVFGHNIVEACTAVKGHALLDLLAAGAEKVVYLDPDTAVFAELDPLTDALDRASIVLTPHRLHPETDRWAVAAHEVGSLRTGIYNFGCYAVRNDDTGTRFARWWSDRLYEFCLDDPAFGTFTDQKWGNHVPVFFPDVEVCTDPGINVASWNLRERPLSLDPDGEYRARGERLRLFHFTKARTVGPAATMQNAPGNIHVAEVWRWYLDELDTVACQADLRHPWAYGVYGDGSPVEEHHRKIYRDRRDLREIYPDPLSCEQPALGEFLTVTAVL